MCRRRQNGSGPRVLADSSPNAEQKADAYHRETNCPVEMRFVEHLGEIPRPKRDGSGQISFAGYLVDRGLKRGVARFHGRVRHKFVVEQSNSTTELLTDLAVGDQAVEPSTRGRRTFVVRMSTQEGAQSIG